ncbi:TonB-dependent receptor plug domain-containing protein [Hyphococcus luteus]|nr:TonB-dependent receptor [Marinicaulis flavus]
MKTQLKLKTALLSCASACVMAAQPAWAQDEGVQDTITVTGTRISDFDAPTPVTAFDEEEIDRKAVFRISDLVVDVPAFVPHQNIGKFSEAIGTSYFNLRGLGFARTLTLLDGRRLAPTSPDGIVDTNVIPLSLIKKVEIVTGGASAAYGSDAVSGVVNLTLDHRLEGVKGDIQYGISTYDDVSAPAVSLAAGHSFADDRLHIVAGFDFYDNNGQLAQGTRPWGDDNTALVTLPDGPPNRTQANNAVYSQLTYGGVSSLNNIPELQGIQFGPGGEVQPFQYGTAVGSTWMIGGDGVSMANEANIYPKVSRQAGYARATFDLTDTTELFADALYSHTYAFSDSAYVSTNRSPLAIDIDNPFLPQGVRDIMMDNGVDTYYLRRILGEQGPITNANDIDYQRYGAGAKGELSGGWNWDVTFQYSKSNFYREDGGNTNLRRLSLGTDVVLDPMTNDPVCRSSLNNPSSTDPDIANCVPVNLFGEGSLNGSALDYISGTAVLDSEQKQTLVSFNLSGSPFQTWAGDVSVAVGGEWRKDELSATTDPISAMTGWYAVNSQPLSGEVSVKEAYTEVVVPLMSDQPMGYSMDVNGAARVTDYSTSGTVVTWKAGMNYSPTPDIRFRGTYSRDIRAPSVNELFSGQSQFVNQLVDPRDNSNPTVPLLTGGNPTLDPEKSNAWTVGVVLTPGFANGLSLSFDYYSFKIKDAIASLDGQTIVDNCFILMQTSLCDAIMQNSNGNITEVQATLLNAAAASAKGFDVQMDYGVPFLSGDLNFSVLANYVGELSTTISGVKSDVVGQLASETAGGVPEWRFNLGARYVTDDFAAGVLVRYVDNGVFRTAYTEGVDIDDNTIPSRTYVDVDISKRITENIQLYGKINNLFNVAPPAATTFITQPNYNGGAFHDRIGRYFKVGARFQF